MKTKLRRENIISRRTSLALVVLVGTMALATTTAADPPAEPQSPGWNHYAVGTADWTWYFPSGLGPLAPDTYYEQVSLEISIQYHCDGDIGVSCGGWAVIGNVATAVCEWKDGEYNWGEIAEVVSGADLASSDCEGTIPDDHINGGICSPSAYMNAEGGAKAYSTDSTATCTGN